MVLSRPIGGRERALHIHIGMAPALPALLGPRGGICTTMEIMDHHSTEANLQSMACWAFVNFPLCADCKALLLAEGGLDRILRAMRAHPKHYAVQYMYCRGQIASGCTRDEGAENSHELREES